MNECFTISVCLLKIRAINPKILTAVFIEHQLLVFSLKKHEVSGPVTPANSLNYL